MAKHDAAARIVEIQDSLRKTRKVTPRTLRMLLEEQRVLWDRHFPGQGFEVVSAQTK
jgi:hypothetical protein